MVDGTQPMINVGVSIKLNITEFTTNYFPKRSQEIHMLAYALGMKWYKLIQRVQIYYQIDR